MKQFFWVFPFIFFILGYYATFLLVSADSLTSPCLVGRSVRDAVVELSRMRLNARILYEKDESDLPPGTVLHQIPHPEQRVKQNQPFFLVIAKRPQMPEAPCVTGSTVDAISEILVEKGIRLKKFFLPSGRPKGEIIAQWPLPGVELDPRTLLTYTSSGNSQLFFVFPDLRGKSLIEVKEFIENYELTLEISDPIENLENFDDSKLFVKSHKPLAGSLVNFEKSVHVRVDLKGKR